MGMEQGESRYGVNVVVGRESGKSLCELAVCLLPAWLAGLGEKSGVGAAWTGASQLSPHDVTWPALAQASNLF
jgi:hypothetical protein